MDRLDAMRVFTRIVERQSFSRAAQDMGLPASTATDAVKQIERRLGVRLLDRTTRQVRPTPDGEAYYRSCLSILDNVEDAESTLSGAEPKGLLRVNLLGSQARRIILPALPDFYERYPQIDLYLGEADHFVDLLREGVDCVIRSGQPDNSELVGRQIALLHETTVASPAYLERHGRPQSWDALDGHQMIGYHSSALGAAMPLEFVVEGEVKTVALPSRLTVSGTDTLLAAALEGLGIIQVPRYAVARHIETGTLVELLSHTPPTAMPIHIFYHSRRHLSLRVRTFIDWVVELYRDIDERE